jgi:hypothetical protein
MEPKLDGNDARVARRVAVVATGLAGAAFGSDSMLTAASGF